MSLIIQGLRSLRLLLQGYFCAPNPTPWERYITPPLSDALMAGGYLYVLDGGNIHRLDQPVYEPQASVAGVNLYQLTAAVAVNVSPADPVEAMFPDGDGIFAVVSGSGWRRVERYDGSTWSLVCRADELVGARDGLRIGDDVYIWADATGASEVLVWGGYAAPTGGSTGAAQGGGLWRIRGHILSHIWASTTFYGCQRGGRFVGALSDRTALLFNDQGACVSGPGGNKPLANAWGAVWTISGGESGVAGFSGTWLVSAFPNDGSSFQAIGSADVLHLCMAVLGSRPVLFMQTSDLGGPSVMAVAEARGQVLSVSSNRISITQVRGGAHIVAVDAWGNVYVSDPDHPQGEPAPTIWGTYTVDGELNGRPVLTNGEGAYLWWDGEHWVISAYPGGPALYISATGDVDGAWEAVNGADQLPVVVLDGWVVTGDADADGTYIPTGETYNGREVYENENGYSLWWDGSKWVIGEEVGGTPLYTNGDTPGGSWTGGIEAAAAGWFTMTDATGTLTFYPTGGIHDDRPVYQSPDGYTVQWDTDHWALYDPLGNLVATEGTDLFGEWTNGWTATLGQVTIVQTRPADELYTYRVVLDDPAEGVAVVVEGEGIYRIAVRADSTAARLDRSSYEGARINRQHYFKAPGTVVDVLVMTSGVDPVAPEAVGLVRN